MVAALILVISVAALLKFGVFYVRALMAGVASEPLSERLGSYLSGGTSGGGNFGITCVLSQLCPEIEPDASAATRATLAPIRAYYRVLEVLQGVSRHLLPPMSAWIEREMATCSRYAAVVVDHRLARNLEAIARIHAC